MAKKFLKLVDESSVTGLRGYGIVLGNGAAWIASLQGQRKKLQRFKNVSGAQREFSNELKEDKNSDGMGHAIFIACATENASLFGDYPSEWEEIKAVFKIKPSRSGSINNTATGTVTGNFLQAGNIDTGGRSLEDFLRGDRDC